MTYCINKKYCNDRGEHVERLFDPKHFAFKTKDEAYDAAVELADGDCDELADSYDVTAIPLEKLDKNEVSVVVKYCNKTTAISTYSVVEVPDNTICRVPHDRAVPSATADESDETSKSNRTDLDPRAFGDLHGEE